MLPRCCYVSFWDKKLAVQLSGVFVICNYMYLLLMGNCILCEKILGLNGIDSFSVIFSLVGELSYCSLASHYDSEYV